MGMVNRNPIANREAPALKTAHIGWMVRLAVSERLRWPDLVLVTPSYVLHLPLMPSVECMQSVYANGYENLWYYTFVYM